MLFVDPLHVGAKFSRKRGGDAPPRPVFSLYLYREVVHVQLDFDNIFIFNKFIV